MENESQEQSSNSRPWLFKKGQSGNPGGRPKGSKTLKQFAAEMLRDMSDEEKLIYLEGLDKKTIWEQGEGKAKQDIEIEGEIQMLVKIDE